MIQYPGAKVESDDGARLASIVDAETTLRQLRLFVRYAMHWAGDGSLFPYTGQTPAQCFLCFLMYNYPYFNFMFCINHCIYNFINTKIYNPISISVSVRNHGIIVILKLLIYLMV